MNVQHSYGYPIRPIVPATPPAPGMAMPVPVPPTMPSAPTPGPVVSYPAPVTAPVYGPQGHGWVIDRFQNAVDWTQDAWQRLKGWVRPQPTPAPVPQPVPAPAPQPSPNAPSKPRKPKPTKPKPEPKAEPKPEPKPKPKKPIRGRGPLVREGWRGHGIKRLQFRLAKLGFDPGPRDGIFGPRTEHAVKRFQKAKGLGVDGVVGPKTWGLLGIKVRRKSVRNPYPGMVLVQGKPMKAAAARAFRKMEAAARKAGTSLKINSAYRSDAEQGRMFQAAVRKYGSYAAASKWVAPPGKSTHRTGYAIDIEVTGSNSAWLARNAGRFGFYRPYSWEPWHFELRR